MVTLANARHECGDALHCVIHAPLCSVRHECGYALQCATWVWLRSAVCDMGVVTLFEQCVTWAWLRSLNSVRHGRGYAL